MNTSTVAQQSWLTAAENAVATKEERRIIIDTTNWRIIVHDGVTPGGKAQASMADVNTAIAGVSAGANAFLQWLTCS
jgi:hypothetical protein